MSTVSFIAGLIAGATVTLMYAATLTRINGRRLEMPAHVRSFCESDFCQQSRAAAPAPPTEWLGSAIPNMVRLHVLEPNVDIKHGRLHETNPRHHHEPAPEAAPAAPKKDINADVPFWNDDIQTCTKDGCVGLPQPADERRLELDSSTTDCSASPREAVADFLEATGYPRNPSASALASRRGTDKIWRHQYQVMYGPLLAPYIRAPKVSVLEIGVQDGLSLNLWRRLFKHCDRLVAIGYGQGAVSGRKGGSHAAAVAKSELKGGGTLYHGDQSSPDFLASVERDLDGHRFTVIIDDGSHVPWHQVYTLKRIFHWLAPGGVWIVEDIETSYYDMPAPAPKLYGQYEIIAGAGTTGSAVEKLKQVIDVINRKFVLDVNYTALGPRAPGERPADHDVASITFSRNCVALLKKVPEEWSLVDSGVRSGHAPDAAPYRPSGVHDKSRKAWLAYRERSAWKVDGTPAEQ